MLEGWRNSLWLIGRPGYSVAGFTANFAVAQAYVAEITPPERPTQSMGSWCEFGIGLRVGTLLGGTLGSITCGLTFYDAAACAR